MTKEKDFAEVPQEALEVIELFEAHGDALRFPDLDAVVLKGFAKETADAAAVLRETEAALSHARQAHRDATERVLAQARRAVAYARIYAEGDPELSEALDQVALARPQKQVERKPRQAKTKRRSTHEAKSEEAEELPFANQAPQTHATQ